MVNKTQYKVGAQFRYQKKWGQNFLINPRVLQKIVASAEVGPKDLVVEVGTGEGNLTSLLVQKAGAVIGFEIDPRLFSLTRGRCHSFSNLHLYQGDFLQFSMSDLIESFPGFNYKMVSNLPYSISSPVLFKVLESEIPWKVVVLMVQKEFGERVLSPPGERESGLLSLAVHMRMKVEKIMFVSRFSFRPAPQVDSVLLKLTPRIQAVELVRYRAVMEVARVLFSQRRKKIGKTLSRSLALPQGEKLLTQLGIDPALRPENLRVEQWICLSQAIAEQKEGGAVL